MGWLFGLAAFATIALVVGGLLAVALFVLKLVFWVVFLPIRLFFKLLFLPFILLKWAFVGVAGLVLLPLLLIAGLVAVIAMLVAVVTPLLPILFVAAAIWVLVQIARPATA